MIGRTEERERLARARDAAPELVILRGRRRIGKSFLVTQTLSGDRTVYFQADQQPEGGHLRALGREAGRLVGGGELRFDDWDAAFTFFGQQARAAPLVLALDEFQWLWDAQPAIDSILQRHWDQWERDRVPIVVVLSGSALTLMESLLARDRPLYGRATYRPLLLPFDHHLAAGFARPALTAEERIRRFSVLGGTPQYQAWAGDLTLDRVLRERILRVGEPLYEEPLHLLREERAIRDPGSYFAVLQAIAAGATHHNEIANQAGVSTAALAKMLTRLIELGYVELREPAQPFAGKGRPRYVIADPYFGFWFRFVMPNRSRIEAGRTEEVAVEIEARLDDLAGPVFEECCRTWARVYATADRFPPSERIGGYWTRTYDVEVDIVGTAGGAWTAVGSVKWGQSVDARVLDQLLRHQEAMGTRAAHAQRLIFGRGFAPTLVQRAAQHDVRLVPIEEIA